MPENAPENFNGAVGEFKIELSTTKKELNASESVQATLKVSGSGNLKLFSIPSLVTPSSIEKYDPEYKENVKTNIKGMYGNILDTYTLVPQFKGKYPISPVKFVFFDPKTRAYKSVFSNEIIINVLEGPSFSSSDNSIILFLKYELADTPPPKTIVFKLFFIDSISILLNKLSIKRFRRAFTFFFR